MNWLMRLLLTLFTSALSLSVAFAATPNLPPAQSTGFNPPSTDYSMLFLSNLFGIVDGVLAGTGSQIMGAIFSVFNTAVLALGGIITLHAVMLTTINTAHEGEFLGKKFSTLWVPLRIAAGVALLLPKANGYCYMQIFVMWVVVQGVGVADKIWATTLGYMQRGGVLIQPVAANNTIAGTGQTASLNGNNASALQSQATGAAIMATQQKNAGSMLQIATCLNMMQYHVSKKKMEGMQNGECASATPPWYCAAPGNLMGGADFMAAGATTAPNVTVPSVIQPELAFLNGLCGSISWTPYKSDEAAILQKTGLKLDPLLLLQAAQARTLAVQQMWIQAESIGGMIVINRYSNPASSIAPLGVSTPDGLRWQSGVTGLNPLLSGVEMSQIAGVYLGIMAPTLNAMANSFAASADFIRGAIAKGWIMAGSYFFEVANLNAVSSRYAADNGVVNVNAAPAFCQSCIQNGVRGLFSTGEMSDYTQLLDFQVYGASNCDGPDPTSHLQSLSSYLCNTSVLKSMGQLGTQTPQFAVHYQVNWQTIPYLPEKTFTGGFMNLPGMSTTVGYFVLRIVLNKLLEIMNKVLAMAMDTIVRPIVIMTIPMFTSGLEVALANYTNPIIALTQMGNNFINLSIAVWLLAMIGTTILSAIPYTSAAGTAIAVMLMPYVGLWLSAMFTAGASMAYYIPLLPYILFTFGAMGWFISVIESMVAAPLVALGIMIPEGEDVMGKSSPAMLILLNVFLRPGLMIIGFVIGIILSYVGIWLLNTGFQSVLTGLIGPSDEGVPQDAMWAQQFGTNPNTPPGTLSGFAAIIGIIFMIIVYIVMYTSIVKIALEKAMFKLADDILTWLSGGMPLAFGKIATESTEDTEKAVGKTAKALESSAGSSQSGGKEKKKKQGKKSGAKGGAKGGAPKGGGGR